MRKLVFLFLSVALLSFAIISFATFSFANKRKQWKQVEESMQTLAYLAEQAELRERFFQQTIKVHTNSSFDFYQKALENLEFGKEEKQRIKKILESPAFFGHPLLETRMQTLEKQMIKFNKKKVYSSKNFNEFEYSLEKPLYLDANELVALLKVLESSDPSKPFSELLFFSCKREKIEELNELYRVNFSILTKEWRL